MQSTNVKQPNAQCLLFADCLFDTPEGYVMIVDRESQKRK